MKKVEGRRVKNLNSLGVAESFSVQTGNRQQGGNREKEQQPGGVAKTFLQGTQKKTPPESLRVNNKE